MAEEPIDDAIPPSPKEKDIDDAIAPDDGADRRTRECSATVPANDVEDADVVATTSTDGRPENATPSSCLVGITQDSSAVSVVENVDSSPGRETAGHSGASAVMQDGIDLDVAKSDKYLTKPIQVLPGLLAHTVGNLVGGATLGAGWALGKADAAAGKRGLTGAQQVADSRAFKVGFKTWLSANGIFPTVLCEKGPYGNDIGPLPKDPQERRRFLRSTPLICSNHVSYLDTVVLPLVLEVPKLMAMAEVATWPLFGQLCAEMDMIWVDRADEKSRKAAMNSLADHVAQWQMGDRPLLMWPEGTTSNGRSLKEFKVGAFAQGKSVRPVVIKYTGEWDPANVNFREMSGKEKSASPQNGFADHVGYGDTEWAQQFLGHLLHTCTVLICRPYHPSEEEIADPNLFRANVRELMLQRLNELHAMEDKKTAEKQNSVGRGLQRGVDKLFQGIAGRVSATLARQADGN